MLFTDLRPRRTRLADEGRGHELSATLANLTQGQDLVVMVARASPSPARQRLVFTTAIPATARLLAPSPAPRLRQYQQITEWSCKSGAAGEVWPWHQVACGRRV